MHRAVLAVLAVFAVLATSVVSRAETRAAEISLVDAYPDPVDGTKWWFSYEFWVLNCDPTETIHPAKSPVVITVPLLATDNLPTFQTKRADEIRALAASAEWNCPIAANRVLLMDSVVK